MERVFYRIVRSATPTADDFWTNKNLGIPLLNPDYEREWAGGISVYDSRDFAFRRARTNRADLGRYVVPMNVPADSGVEVRQTTRDSRHSTLYAERERALALVSGAAVSAIEQDEDDE